MVDGVLGTYCIFKKYPLLSEDDSGCIVGGIRERWRLHLIVVYDPDKKLCWLSHLLCMKDIIRVHNEQKKKIITKSSLRFFCDFLRLMSDEYNILIGFKSRK